MQHFRLLVLPACAALALSACTGEDPEPTAAPSTAAPTVTESPTPSPEPEPTPSEEPSPEPEPSPTEFQSFPPAPEDETDEQRAIREGWEEHQRVVDSYLKDPDRRDMTELQATLTGAAEIDVANSVMNAYQAGLKRVGDVQFRDVQVGTVQQDSDGNSIAEVTYCKDFTQQQLVNVESGEPLDSEQVETVIDRAVMMLDDRGVWVVSQFLQGKNEPC